MKTVGIVTLFGLYNFGNRLQNYAVQEIFKSYGYEVRTILSSENDYKIMLKFWLRAVRDGKFVRSYKFYKFNKKFIKTYTVPGRKLLFPQSLREKFDYFVVGSDQVWNPDIRQNQRPNFFLQFADKEQRIAIAPSLAVPSIPERWNDCYIEGLKGFNQISVRESNSVEMIKKMVGIEVTLLSDPTIVIPIEKWVEIERKVKTGNKPYLLEYFLGSVDDNRQMMINAYANNQNMQIINLNEKKWIGVGPDEFLYLVHHSSCVCTDSFHCVVFSILFNRQFAAFERKNNSENDVNSRTCSRIMTLLKKFGLEDHLMSDDKYLSLKSYSNTNVEQVISAETEKYYQYLHNQLLVK